MTDINCDKRQKEVKTDRQGNETEEYRCVEKKTPDTYLKIVDVPTCQGCPLLAIKNASKKCNVPQWEKELLSVKAVSRDAPPGKEANPEYAFEQPCPLRFDGKCRVTGRAINPDICKICDHETAEHMATLPEMGVGFAGEVRRWIREGRPVRTDEEVAVCLKVCKGDPESPDPEKQKPCQLYDPDKKACKKCGCAMNDSSWPLRNGIKMKTKICPMGLWR